MRRSLAALAAVVMSVAVVPLGAQDAAPARTLVPGKGADLTMARCAVCHEITHITRARLSRGEWQDNVKNMIERGAPIAPEEIPVIVDYLSAYYSRDGAAPAAEAEAAPAQDPVQRLLADNACLGCHGVDQKIVGPSFKEVASRYAGDAAAKAKLAAKIRTGGAGNWGNVPMPPHAALTDAQLAALTDWVLARR